MKTRYYWCARKNGTSFLAVLASNPQLAYLRTDAATHFLCPAQYVTLAILLLFTLSGFASEPKPLEFSRETTLLTGTLPPAFTVDQNGKPLHSWRVLLLPYLGKAPLYKKIRRNEPWDSEHNRQFHQTLVEVYRCPGKEVFPDSLEQGMTTYSVVLGESTPFNTLGQGRNLHDFGENCQDMIFVLETRNPVCWMDPTSGVTLAEMKNPKQKTDQLMDKQWMQDNIFSSHLGVFNAALRSGRGIAISNTIDLNRFFGVLQGTRSLYGQDDIPKPVENSCLESGKPRNEGRFIKNETEK